MHSSRYVQKTNIHKSTVYAESLAQTPVKQNLMLPMERFPLNQQFYLNKSRYNRNLIRIIIKDGSSSSNSNHIALLRKQTTKGKLGKQVAGFYVFQLTN